MFMSVRSFVCISIIYAVYDTRVCQALSSISLSRTDGVQQRLKDLTAKGGMILLDGDNVRGKTKFKLSKEELCANVETWMESACLYGQVTLIYDHASQHSAYFLPKSGLSVVFSGPGRTADDVISRDSNWIMRKLQSDVIVVTEDNGLKKRCRTEIKGSASARGKKKGKKAPKTVKQVTTPAQQLLLESMKTEQIKRDEEKKSVLAGVEGVNEKIENSEIEGEVTGIEGDNEIKEGKKDEKDLTFVSSLLFAEMILKSFHIEKKDKIASIESENKSEITSSPPSSPFPFFPSSPSPSSTSLDVKGSKYGLELALIRREVELRKQLSGFETSLLTCSRKAAVKIRVRIATLTDVLAVCVADGIEAKKQNSKENTIGNVAVEIPKLEVIGEKLVGSVGDKIEVDGTVVDRGSELLENLLSNGRPVGTIEETWERIILAENMRFSLQALYGVQVGEKEGEKKVEKEAVSGGDVRNTVDGTISENKIEVIECNSSKYVSHVNENFNSVKRLAAVIKA